MRTPKFSKEPESNRSIILTHKEDDVQKNIYFSNRKIAHKNTLSCNANQSEKAKFDFICSNGDLRRISNGESLLGENSMHFLDSAKYFSTLTSQQSTQYSKPIIFGSKEKNNDKDDMVVKKLMRQKRLKEKYLKRYESQTSSAPKRTNFEIPVVAFCQAIGQKKSAK